MNRLVISAISAIYTLAIMYIYYGLIYILGVFLGYGGMFIGCLSLPVLFTMYFLFIKD